MAKLSEAIGKVDAALADGTAFQKDPRRLPTWRAKRAEAAADALVAVEEEWLALSSEIEAATA